MNYFNKKNIIIWILVVLFIVNITAIGTIFYQMSHFRQAAVRHFIDQEPPHFIKKRLGLNEKQAGWIHEQRMLFRDTAEVLFEEFHQLRTDMANEMSKDKPNREVLRDIAAKYGALHEQLKMLTVDHFLSMKEKLKPEQQEQLNIFMHDLFKHEPKRSFRHDRDPENGKGRRFNPPF